MADLLPESIVIKPIIFADNLHYAGYQINENVVYCKGTSVFDPYVKIEVELAKINTQYVNLRFYQSNRYWARSDGDNSIVAVSKQPEEDTSKLACTLFEPTLGSDNNLRFIHVQSGGRVRTDFESSRIYVDDKNNGGPADYAFSFVDWGTLVKIPKNVAFKGDNDMYLKAILLKKQPYNQVSLSDGNEKDALYEVTLHPDGHLRIKSVYFKKFCRNSPEGWILADTSDDTGKDVNTLFWPVKIDDCTIALRCAGKFCVRFNKIDYSTIDTESKLSDCLTASAGIITKQARFIVEDRVLETEIYNVEYQMADARIYDKQPFVAGIGTATNESNEESSTTIHVSYQRTTSSSFSRSLSLSVAAKTTIEAGIPLIMKAKIEISPSVTGILVWGKTTTETLTADATYVAKVPPNKRVTVKYMCTHGKCSVPFSYTRREQSSTDGQVVTSRHVDGMFKGVNYYSFYFDELKIEPLKKIRPRL